MLILSDIYNSLVHSVTRRLMKNVILRETNYNNFNPTLYPHVPRKIKLKKITCLQRFDLWTYYIWFESWQHSYGFD